MKKPFLIKKIKSRDYYNNRMGEIPQTTMHERSF